MTLPGKLTIGFLQEDNPQKFYFRVRPLLTQDENGYHQTENVNQDYLEDGFIRIVPDKNEMSHFKTRMRTLGRYCAVDLRRHPGENDKIRPNKNHNGENGDRNAFIVYSDVIAAVEPLRMAEVVNVDEDGLFPRPGTRLAAIRLGGVIRGVYQWSERDDEGAFVVGDNLASLGGLNGEPPMALTLPDGTQVEILTDLERFGVAMPEESAAEPAPKEDEPAGQPAQAAQVAQPVQKEEPVRSAEPAPREEPASREEPVRNAEPASREKPRDAREAKPWLQSTTYVFPRVVAAKGSGTREQSLAQQSGFNPKRGMSVKDIIDDMWRQSRFDQLGHPVVADTSATPVVSPVEAAMNAFKDAWSLPEARGSLVSALLKLDQLDEALGAGGAPNAAQTREINAGEQQMLRLEADRLKLLGEIDELKRFRQDKRTELLDELRHTHSAEMERGKKQNEQLQAEQKKLAAAAEQARKAAGAAQETFARTLANELDAKMAEQLLNGRAMELMQALSRRACGVCAEPQTEELAAGEMISAVRVRFEEAGIPLTNDEAVNLLACVALGRILIVSGPSGSGKSLTARTLAAALGIAGGDTGCFAELQAQPGWRSLGAEIESASNTGVPLVKLPAVRRVLENSGAAVPTMLMIDGANRGAIDEYLGEMMQLGEQGAPGMLTTGAGSIKLGDGLRVVLTVQDSGSALSGELLDRAWLMRLDGEAADTAWPPKTGTLPKPEKAISLENLKKVFAPGADVPGEVVERVRTLREKLAAAGMRLSRRTLTDLYNYCSAVQPYMTCTPLETLDRAFAERAMPVLLATANLDGLHVLARLLPDMPRSLSLLNAALPLPPM